MFHSRYSNPKINRLRMRALRLVYNDFQSTFDELFDRNKSFTIHHLNIQALVIDIYKIFNDLSTSNYKEPFVFRNNN